MTTKTAPQTHCPTCGMKIARQGLSICSYCSSPLGLGGGVTADSATAQRFSRMAEHKDYAAAMAWTPPEEIGVRRALRNNRRALFLAIVAVGLIAFGILGSAAPLGGPLTWVGAALATTALVLWLRSARTVREARSMPLLRRPALVKNRRSETSPRGGRYSTVYFFDLEFEEGTGEFRFPGRGAHYDPWVPGNTGIAYTRRDVLLEFKLIRV